MATAAVIIAQALGLAGNSALSTSDALNWLNNFLNLEYRKKYSWQRLTATVAFPAGTVTNTTAWPTTFLDFYENEDGSVGSYTLSGTITSPRGLTYRQYVNMADRLSATGQPRCIVADPVTSTWFVYPVPDQAYTISVPYYQLPAALALSDTPLWSSYAPDAILVQAVKQAALEWQDDNRQDAALSRLGAQVGAYRRKDQEKEGVVWQTALDQRVFRRSSGDED